MNTKLNWFGLAGGALTIAVVAISLFSPWWQLIVGENLVKANVSPLNTGFNFLGTAFTIPLILALNISSVLILTVAGIAMLIYSVVPAKPYSKHLLGFAYKKPLFSVIFFVVVLYVLIVLVQGLVGLSIPLSGTTAATLPTNMTQGETLTAQISTGFQWPFWTAVTAAALCVAARIYHRKIAATTPKSL